MERLQLQENFKTLQAKEKLANKLASINSQQLERFLRQRKRLLAIAVDVSYLGDAVFGGSSLGSLIGVVTRNPDLFLLFLPAVASGSAIAFAGEWESQKIRKTIEMAENESIVRGLKMQQAVTYTASDTEKIKIDVTQQS